MKNLKVTTTVFAIIFGTFTVWSCKDNKTEETHAMEMTDQQETIQSPVEKVSYNIDGSESTTEIVNTYLKIKDALVSENGEAAKEAGKMTLQALENFKDDLLNAEQQGKINAVLITAKAHANEISKSEIKEQRVAFKQLSEEVTNIIAIAGTNAKLYVQYCPMYDRGSAWLSSEKDIKNPYYGSKMLACGNVKKEIN